MLIFFRMLCSLQPKFVSPVETHKHPGCRAVKLPCIRKLKGMLLYMKPETFLKHCKLFFL